MSSAIWLQARWVTRCKHFDPVFSTILSGEITTSNCTASSIHAVPGPAIVMLMLVALLLL